MDISTHNRQAADHRFARPLLLSLVVLFIATLIQAAVADEKRHRVLVVMSYEENNPWCQEIRNGIESVLGASADIRYEYMDTKVNFDGGAQKAAAAFETFKAFKPDGVITVDDNAQWMFVKPYLQDQTLVPVMFCGVNAEAEKYGYPNEHISGILERGHIRESLAFVRQLSPGIGEACVVVRNSPSGKALTRQVDSERDTYPVPVTRTYALDSVADIRRLADVLRDNCDTIYIDSLEGIVDDVGKGLDNAAILKVLKQHYSAPIIGANSYHVRQGALSAVVKTGQEQGETAASMLLKAMNGTPVSEIPITRNYKGRRLINVNTMDEQGITPRPIVLRGATLVRGTD